MASSAPQHSVIIVGAGAAGLWTALLLLERGFPAEQLKLIEPSGKTANDRTWSYWSTDRVMPAEVPVRSFKSIRLGAANEQNLDLDTNQYSYYTARAATFYAYAKQVLAKAGVTWVKAVAHQITEQRSTAYVHTDDGQVHEADYILDGRPISIDLSKPHVQATLQHFGGWYVDLSSDCVDPERVVLMDFADFEDGVGFFYVIPSGRSTALIELAVFSDAVWSQERYDQELRGYIERRYQQTAYNITEREYGVIPMTDEPLWKSATDRVWPIGTRGGWVQPSSGYAFTRIKRFADSTAGALMKRRPKAWRPSAVQQIFNSTMLRYILEDPSRAAPIFLRLFERNGADRTFRFLDESTGFAETLKLMWNSPRTAFTKLALHETWLRIAGKK